MFNLNILKSLHFHILLFGLFGFFYYFLFRNNIVGLNYFNINSLGLDIYAYSFIYSLPSLIHIVIFSLITYIILDRKKALFSIFFWLIINIVFEVFQALNFKQLSYFPEFIRSYGLNGTFDWMDILFLFIGAIISFVLITVFEKKGEV